MEKTDEQTQAVMGGVPYLWLHLPQTELHQRESHGVKTLNGATHELSFAHSPEKCDKNF